MDGGLESRCVGCVYGVDVAVRIYLIDFFQFGVKYM